MLLLELRAETELLATLWDCDGRGHCVWSLLSEGGLGWKMDVSASYR
jgi:hypothetical protein